MSTIKKSIVDLYNNVKVKFPSIIQVEDRVIAKINSHSERDQEIYNTKFYLFTIFITTLTIILSLPGLYYLKLTSGYISEFLKFLITLPDDFRKIFLLIPCITLFYLIAIPYLKLYRFKIFSASPQFAKICMKHSGYQFFLWTYIYLSILCICIILYTDYSFYNEIQLKILATLVNSVITVLFIVLLMISLILISKMLFKQVMFSNFYYSHNVRFQIIYRLLLAINHLEKNDEIFLYDNKKRVLMGRNLNKINDLLKSYPISTYGSTAEDTTIFFSKASSHFKWITNHYFYSESNSAKLIVELITYLNCFLLGDLSQLPQREEIIEVQPNKKARIIHYILLLIYVIAPVASIILLKKFFKIELDAQIEYFFKILYVVWVFLGIFANPFIINGDTKEFIKDVFKSILK